LDESPFTVEFVVVSDEQRPGPRGNSEAARRAGPRPDVVIGGEPTDMQVCVPVQRVPAVELGPRRGRHHGPAEQTFARRVGGRLVVPAVEASAG